MDDQHSVGGALPARRGLPREWLTSLDEDETGLSRARWDSASLRVLAKRSEAFGFPLTDLTAQIQCQNEMPTQFSGGPSVTQGV
jgi:hypothetical protein